MSSCTQNDAASQNSTQNTATSNMSTMSQNTITQIKPLPTPGIQQHVSGELFFYLTPFPWIN